MDTLQETVLGMMEKDHRVNPALLQMKLKLTHDKASELCHWAWNYRAKDCFFLRNFGMSMVDYEKGDHLDG
jgi:hypothetical protein